MFKLLTALLYCVVPVVVVVVVSKDWVCSVSLGFCSTSDSILFFTVFFLLGVAVFEADRGQVCADSGRV